MNYNKLSDFEINKAVAEVKHPNLTFGHSPRHAISKASVFADEVYCNDRYGGEFIYNFTGSWADMGPIAFEKGISLLMDGVNFPDKNISAIAYVGDWDNRKSKSFHHKKPLRAAAIVSLMIQESIEFTQPHDTDPEWKTNFNARFNKGD